MHAGAESNPVVEKELDTWIDYLLESYRSQQRSQQISAYQYQSYIHHLDNASKIYALEVLDRCIDIDVDIGVLTWVQIFYNHENPF